MPRKIEYWQCFWCGKRYTFPHDCEEHEKKCTSNPNNEPRVWKEPPADYDYTNGCCTALAEGHQGFHEKNCRPKIHENNVTAKLDRIIERLEEITGQE